MTPPPDPNSQLTKSLDDLTHSVNQLRDELVRKDVFFEVQRNIDTRFKNLEEDVAEIRGENRVQADDRKADRRLLIAAFIGPLVMLLIGIYIAAQVGGPPT